jgi:nickel-type superoxide dismutase maturation protease
MRDKKDMADSLLGERRGRPGAYPPPSAANHPDRRLPALVLCFLAGTAVAAVLLSRCFRRLEVEGDSMRPVLLPGDRVVVRLGARPRPGDVVALTDPRQPGRTVIKRVAAGPVDAGYVVLGDNLAASTDSRHFGPVEPSAITGRVVWRYWPDNRRGRIPLSAIQAHAL